jgi:hypothetical protein
MSSTTTKPPAKNSKRRKTKLQPVTSGSKPGTPGPLTGVNSGSLDSSDSDAKSGSGPDSALIGLTSQPPSSPASFRLQVGEPEPVLNVIGTPVLPSHPPTPAPIPTLLSPTVIPKNKEPAAPAPFNVNEEFIAFTFSDSDGGTGGAPIREWDQGKQSQEVEKRGKKRKSGEISRDDREYDRDGRRDRGRDRDRDRRGERGQRVEHVPRHAPWVANVDWDRCSNVAEL